MNLGWVAWASLAMTTTALTCLTTLIITTIRETRREREQARDEMRRSHLTRTRVQKIRTGTQLDTKTLMLPHLRETQPNTTPEEP